MVIWLIFVGVLVLYVSVGVWAGLEFAALNGKQFKYPAVLRFLRFVGDRAMGSWFIPVHTCYG
jgi:hypothetical protein